MGSEKFKNKLIAVFIIIDIIIPCVIIAMCKHWVSKLELYLMDTFTHAICLLLALVLRGPQNGFRVRSSLNVYPKYSCLKVNGNLLCGTVSSFLVLYRCPKDLGSVHEQETGNDHNRHSHLPPTSSDIELTQVSSLQKIEIVPS